MPCTIETPTWNSVFALEGELAIVDGSFFLRIQLDDGSVLDLILDENTPLAMQVTDGSPVALEYAFAGWKNKCKATATTSFKLDPRHTAGNFKFRKDGTGIGISDIRDDSFRAIYINLYDFPITFERINDDVFIRFQNDTSNYFISPKLSTG
jgi:hypothetical protein